jgi:hypothetical protein
MRRPNTGERLTPFSDGDGAASLSNVIEQGKALGFELGNADDLVTHRFSIPLWSSDHNHPNNAKAQAKTPTPQ